MLEPRGSLPLRTPIGAVRDVVGDTWMGEGLIVTAVVPTHSDGKDVDGRRVRTAVETSLRAHLRNVEPFVVVSVVR